MLETEQQVSMPVSHSSSPKISFVAIPRSRVDPSLPVDLKSFLCISILEQSKLRKICFVYLLFFVLVFCILMTRPEDRKNEN